MGFPGTWMTESESVVYRVVPKCACSTIGQVMYYSDQRHLLRRGHPRRHRRHAQMGDGGQPAADHRQCEKPWQLCLHLRAQPLYPHPVVLLRQDLRHPAQRQTLSRQPGAAADPEYGIEVGEAPDFEVRPDQVVPPASFCSPATRSAGAARWSPTSHWSAMSGHISTFIVNGGTYDNHLLDRTVQRRHAVGARRDRNAGQGEPQGRAALQRKAKATGRNAPTRWRNISTILSMHLVYEILQEGLPALQIRFRGSVRNKMPIGEIDLEEVHAKLGD